MAHSAGDIPAVYLSEDGGMKLELNKSEKWEEENCES
jgi:hypothetical protein